jgi:hypothetical protein
MDSGTISALVFLVFGAVVFIYGWIVYRDLARLRDANDHARAKLDVLVRGVDQNEKSTENAELQRRISIEAECFNEAVREFNARIGQFPEAIVAAVMGLRRLEIFRVFNQGKRS